MTLGCRYLLAAVLLMAGVTKVIDPHGFADQLVLHSGLPHGVSLVVAAVLPWLELVCGMCLALGYAVREAAAISTVLLVLLLGYAVTHRSPDDCHCFFFPTPAPLENGWWPSLRNALLLACSAWVAWRACPMSSPVVQILERRPP